MGGDAQSAILRRLLIRPAGLVGGQLNHAPQPRRVEGKFLRRLAVVPELGAFGGEVDFAIGPQGGQQVFDAVATGGSGEFVDEGVDAKGVVNIGHGAHPADAEMILRRTIFGAHVRHRERRIGEAHAQFELFAVFGGGVERGADRRKNRALQPSRRRTLGIDSRLEVHGSDGVIVVETDIFFAAPDDLHRLAELLRKQRCFRYVIGLTFTPEPAAQQGNVTDNVFFFDA